MKNNDSILNAAIILKKSIEHDKLFLKKCKKGELNIMRKMIKKFNININVIDKRNCTPLIIACRKGYINIVHYLLQQSMINIKIRDENGFSALECAIWANKIEIIELLVRTKKINMNEKIPYGIFKNETPYSISIIRGNLYF